MSCLPSFLECSTLQPLRSRFIGLKKLSVTICHNEWAHVLTFQWLSYGMQLGSGLRCQGLGDATNSSTVRSCPRSSIPFKMAADNM